MPRSCAKADAELMSNPTSSTTSMAQKRHRVVQLQDSHILRATQTYFRAFAVDPVARYNAAGTPVYRNDMIDWIVTPILFYTWIRDGSAYTIDGTAGSTFLLLTLPQAVAEGEGTASSSRVANMLSARLMACGNWLEDCKYFSAEQISRKQEFRKKAQEAEERIFGDRKKDLIYGNLMGTDPLAQGRGWASSLLAFCGELVDRYSTEFWCFAAGFNEKFYIRNGLTKAGSFTLGENDATWKEPPLVVVIMVMGKDRKVQAKL
ncbi:hypothetical protein B0H10DRAFT_1990028 [Mycena sp. CBHHK59/15]|nr:hypothetical protein B0H10DRAFT_1990028 [Mycena sp. CBHHK59/15]